MSAYLSYTDNELLSLIKEDDVLAFKTLYDKYWKQLLIRANYLLGSNQDAEDTVHDLFVDLWKRKHDLNIRNSFITYITAAVNYMCLHRIAERKTISLNEENNEYEISDLHTEEYLSFRDLQHQLTTVLENLPEKCRLIFKMSRDEGKSDKQIAVELDLSVHTIRTQKHRALSKLRFSLTRMLLFTFM